MSFNVKFDKGQIPTVAMINKATVELGVDLVKLTDVLQKQVQLHIGPVWGVGCDLEIAEDFKPGTWAIVFVDDPDIDGALGYHDLTPDGFPLSKVFVKTVQSSGQSVSVTASHELLEMLLDPAINMVASHPNGSFYAYEICDACEGETYKIDDLDVSDFVYPSYFEGFRQPNSTQFDHLNRISYPFQILPGGYMPVFKDGKWTNIFGSRGKALAFAQEDRRGHRSEFRGI